jgi:hypothetical protein
MLGCSLRAGDTIETDVDGRTGVPGVYAAAGAATELSRSVSNAIGTGSRVAYAVALDAPPLGSRAQAEGSHRSSYGNWWRMSGASCRR